jgi:hypothetical protein
MSTGSLVVEVCEVRQERLLHMLSQIRTRLKAFNNIMTRVGYWQSGHKKNVGPSYTLLKMGCLNGQSDNYTSTMQVHQI